MINNKFILVAGPCAAESAEQVQTTAQAVATIGMKHGLMPLLRAGIWKPRTSPDTFQGIGKKGLPWLIQAQQDTQLSAATEVATVEQLQQTLQAGITAIWIGARTGADPIAVQHLADAISLAPVKPQFVLIKNPVNEDAALWIGNIVRIQSALKGSDTHIIAVHRGCNHRPCWHMAHSLRKAMPDMPILLDPSHISGDASLISQLMLKAVSLGYNGWMVEVHPNPSQAMSDSKQQITPSTLDKILSECSKFSQSSEFSEPSELLWLRAQIDEVDETIWTAIADRLHIVQQIGTLKQQYGMDAYQPERYQTLLNERLTWAQKNGLPEETVRSILNAIHDACVNLQRH